MTDLILPRLTEFLQQLIKKKLLRTAVLEAGGKYLYKEAQLLANGKTNSISRNKAGLNKLQELLEPFGYMPMYQKEGRNTRKSRTMLTDSQKDQLLRMLFIEKQSIRQAASQVGVLPVTVQMFLKRCETRNRKKI